MPPPVSQSATLDGLPKPFVGALRTLFDIMDDKGAGFVKFSGKSHFRPIACYFLILTEGLQYSRVPIIRLIGTESSSD